MRPFSPRRGFTVVALAAALAACAGQSSEAGTGESDGSPQEIMSGSPLPPQQVRALEALSSASPVTPINDADGGHGHGHGHGHAAVTGEASKALEAELAVARRAAEALMKKRRLSEADYYVGSYWSRGVGTHFINWQLVGQRFDPARPAMVLVDTTPGRPRLLAGFSYWVRSDSGPPDGFVGESDEWHNHRGLCFVDNVLVSERVENPPDCAGVWIDGTGLWMLHAWVVPGFNNPDGVFAPTNPRMCPPRQGPDAAWC